MKLKEYQERALKDGSVENQTLSSFATPSMNSDLEAA